MITAAEEHQVRSAIGGLSERDFERFCCSLLAREYPQYAGIESSLNALGKTTKGTPDAHARLADGSIAAFQFTTQQSGVQQEVISDIQKIAGPACHFGPEVSEVVVCLATPLQSEIALYEHEARKHRWRLEVLSLDRLTRYAAKHADLCLQHLRVVISAPSSAGETRYYDCGPRVREAREGAGFSTSRLIERADLPSERLLKQIEAGDVECPLTYAERIATLTSVSLRWLLHEEGSRYPSIELSLDHGVEELRELDPAGVYLCLETQRFSFEIVVETTGGAWRTFYLGFSLDLWAWIDDHRYFPQILRFFDDVHDKLRAHVTGRILPEAVMRQLASGSTHPGKIIKSTPPDRVHWADDLRDVRHRYPIAAGYEQVYGNWFVKLQHELARAARGT